MIYAVRYFYPLQITEPLQIMILKLDWFFYLSDKSAWLKRCNFGSIVGPINYGLAQFLLICRQKTRLHLIMGSMSQSYRLVSVTPAFTDIVVNIEVEGVLPQSKSQSKVQSPKSEDLEWLLHVGYLPVVVKCDIFSSKQLLAHDWLNSQKLSNSLPSGDVEQC